MKLPGDGVLRVAYERTRVRIGISVYGYIWISRGAEICGIRNSAGKISVELAQAPLINMACERWCFNRGCYGAPCRWPCILFLALFTLGFSLAIAEHNDPSRYTYIVPSTGKTLVQFSSAEFSFLPEDEVSLARRRRHATEKTIVATEEPTQEQQREQTAVEQPPSQQPQQLPPQQQSQTVVNTSNMPANVSYSTDYAGATEVQDQPDAVSSTTEASTKPTVLKGKTNLVSPKSTSRPVWVKPTDKSTETVTPQVNEMTSVTEVANDKDQTEADIGDISISKFSNFSNETLTQHNITSTVYDSHQYYNSTFIINEAIGRKYWVDLDNHPELKVNNLLSQSHRRAATVKLKFDFPFYGHKVRNITIATGGFLYTGEYVHSWLAATQYIAPLMANFDTRLSNESFVKYADNGTAFTVEWEKVVLQDKPEAGAFTFQVTLHQNGDIVFVYSVIPLLVESIRDTLHPVKVGLSDAYIMDRIVFFVRRKTIYEYHRVNFNQQDIKNWTVIYLHALPTCLEIDNCKDCLTKLKGFDCKWCAELNQCSTGTFRSRQDWLLKGCEVKKIKDVGNCPVASTTYKEQEEGYDHDEHVHSEEAVTASEMSVKQDRPGTSPLERSREDMTMGVSGIIGILLVVALVVGLVAWAAYAYRNPHSASGQMLIRYRPSQWSWRRGEARYTAATIHM